ncbi:Transposase, Mutator family [Gimesia maris]|uniref:transposase n=1 Tax=Gimesia maris TaxID=122 RepID=UPI00118D439C|nr:transposase [Gimesia maris]QDU15119.1 Transposase, Mutator family [Gimesia maris]
MDSVLLVILHRRLEAELQGVGTREFIKVLRLLERQSKELKRRTRAAGLFPNEESLQRLETAVLVELSHASGTRMRYLPI